MPNQNKNHLVADISDNHHENLDPAYHLNPKQEKEINASLTEIYQGEDGKLVDVSKIEIKRERGFWFWLFTTLLLATVCYAGWFFYGKYVQTSSKNAEIEIAITADESDLLAGQEFNYLVNYKNPTKIELSQAELQVSLPDNFIFANADPAPRVASSSRNNIWEIGRVLPLASGQIKIKEKLMGKAGDKAIINAEMSFIPKNFSSQFRRSASFENYINDNGLNIVIDSYSSVLVGEDNFINIIFKAKDKNYLDKFQLKLRTDEGSGIEFLAAASSTLGTDVARQSELDPAVWTISQVTKTDNTLKIPFKVKEKIKDSENINIDFIYTDNDREFLVYNLVKTIEIVKSELNLGMIINGSRDNQGIELGATLNYSITFSNRGEASMKDVVIMAVLEGDIIDWSTLSDANRGLANNNMVTWTKDQLPILAELAAAQQGTIDFSVKVLDEEKVPKDKKAWQVKSYAQFSISNRADIKQAGDTQSNIIINKINSNLKLNESIRYFNEDNIAVGSGPFPPKVGETSSFRVYWKIMNNLHELDSLKAEVSLPPYVTWLDKATTTLGNIAYDAKENKITWNIGKLPTMVEEIDGEFNIGITPAETDRNTIQVLLPGTKIEANDIETGAPISKITKAKTTMLEDDDIANSDGRIQ
jgi:uncharacterized repeat protein (TIGR01451 family)